MGASSSRQVPGCDAPPNGRAEHVPSGRHGVFVAGGCVMTSRGLPRRLAWALYAVCVSVACVALTVVGCNSGDNGPNNPTDASTDTSDGFETNAGHHHRQGT